MAAQYECYSRAGNIAGQNLPMDSASSCTSSSPLAASPPETEYLIDNNERVVLEVGNFMYKTTISTLKKIPNTYFAAMLSGKYPLVRQPDGSFFIDRDGQHFGSILSFMRSGYLPKPRNRAELKELLLEAEYYCVKDAILEAWVRNFGNKAQLFHEKSLFGLQCDHYET